MPLLLVTGKIDELETVACTGDGVGVEALVGLGEGRGVSAGLGVSGPLVGMSGFGAVKNGV